MKYIILLIFGIFSNFLVCCGEGEIDKIYTDNYSYINTTEHLIRIQAWNNGNLSGYSILPKASILFGTDTFNSGCKINGVRSNNPDCLLIFSDSIRIIFNNSRYLKYKRNTNSKLNILISDNHTIEPIKNGANLKYNFTELDYNNSLACNGNCE